MFQKTTFKLEPYDTLGSGPNNYFSFNFGCAKKPKDGKIELVHGYHSCREGLMSGMRSRIMKNIPTQPTDKTRMLFRWAARSNNIGSDLDVIDGWVSRAVPAIQAFDRLAGWPLTRAYKIDNRYDWLRAYYFLSSRRWMKASYLISLYVMIVRMCKDTRVTGFKNFDGLVDVLSKIQISNKPLIVDSRYVSSSMPYWEAIMKGYPRLFRKRKISYYWDTDRIGGNSGSSEGVQRLVHGDTCYKEVRQELLKIKKELESKSKKGGNKS